MRKAVGWLLVFLGAWAGIWISNVTGYPVIGLGATMLWAIFIHSKVGLVGGRIKEVFGILLGTLGAAAIGLFCAFATGGSTLVFVLVTIVGSVAWIGHINSRPTTR